MDDLKKQISLIDFSKPYDAAGHRNIFNLVDALPLPDKVSTQLPPLLVFYAARNILLPSFIIGQIPDLLDLLSLIESFRKYAILKSDEVLTWQTYYEREKSEGREQDVRLLAANEVRALRGFLNKKDAQRREYIVLVRSLIQLYIHYLWTAPESCLIWKRFNDFFPGSIEGLDGPSELLFHIDLSEDEKEYFKQLKIECQQWVKLVTDWEYKREETLPDERISPDDTVASFNSDFFDAFPQPFKPSDMGRNVEIYIGRVDNMVQKFEEWFPPSIADKTCHSV